MAQPELADRRDRSVRGRLWAFWRAVLRTLRGLGRPPLVLTLLGVAIIAACLLSLNLGFINIGPLEVLRTLTGGGSEQQELVLYSFRLPRIVLALLVGSSLALSGGILQGVSQNGLADPGILGINAGAGVAVIGLLYFSSVAAAPAFLLPVVAFFGAAVAALLIYGLAYKGGSVTPARLLLVGIAVNAGLGAAMLVLSLRLDEQLYTYAVAWLEGTIAGVAWRQVLALLPWSVVLLPLAFYKAHTLNVLNLGDHVATGLGAGVERQRLLLVALAVALAGSAVSVAGGIGFVGLVAPHVARRLVGPNHRVMLPTAMLAGALLLVMADILARNLLAPVELPVGIVVAVIGAPYFLYLLARS